MRKVSYSGQFKKDLKLAEKRGKDINKLKEIILLLVQGKRLPAQLKDHPLTGKWKPRRDLHIEPDWLLIYKIDNDTVHFDRTGSHSDLFK
ncbi:MULTISPECIES: type II toxin-antitoxin system YafQ family toxin [Proteus]|uniref:type II toxin-antitoxin system RelE/ParE family toxin n=1 Tax=Proteus TaxID=583 RepID=UPI0013782C06|nr:MULTISPECIES: type II toxin-antitoxin system YafQ family toxin [Proteus]MDC9735994.1 type II toxin-antitoxin system YafQ family toxin [Proteus mirabilis]MDC9775456.1 type II toxin-antitoxin system YafQ family toxin [Proteus mirabilis]MDC9782424.1 type II toxin-antitoxin system YafQ family toxin [Proteus mirabilis]NBN54169.1 YafQ family addiction module toxin [Proteus sp. G4380]HCD1118728.1 type II toxin-antitoxin system YafQ family toxin [Proteus mirabilis]